jgi:hypothetical protein
MRTAEERGYDAVLQLDDNVDRLGLLNALYPTYRAAMTPGRMIGLLIELSASTTATMLGMQISSVPPTKLDTVRPGYPYSVFIERTGTVRMPYYGPFEDDIMHALEYALHGGANRTAALCSFMTYHKESKSRTGMRQHYDPTRGLEIARRYPQNVSLRVSRRTSSVSDTSRGVRHILRTRGFTPVRVTDRERFLSAEREIRAATQDAVRRQRDSIRVKIRDRAQA